MNFEADFLNGTVVPFDLDSGSSLGRGATADVYSVIFGDKKLAAKVYKSVDSVDEEKIISMVGADELSSHSSYSFAWPIAILKVSGQPRGYLMSSFDKEDHYPLNYYFDSTLFKKIQMQEILSLSNRVEVALSLCKAIKSLHAIECYFVDLKPQNILVNWRTNRCVLLDCDGFSFKSRNGLRFPAGHISTDYISPEAQRENLSPSVLGIEQDNYALGVILFQLFNYAQHPFQGTSNGVTLKSDTNDEHAAAGLYPYGLVSNKLISPRKGSTHKCMPTELRQLFDRSFAGSVSDRVNASEWVEYFENIIDKKRLKRCDHNPTNPIHVHFSDGSCFECLRDRAKSDFKAQTLSKGNLTTSAAKNASPAPTALPQQPKSKTGLLAFVGVVFAILLLAYVTSDGVSPSQSSNTNVATTTRGTSTVAPSYNPTDASQIPTGDLVDISNSSFQKIGETGTLTVNISPTFPVLSISTPRLFTIYRSCEPIASEIQVAQETLKSLGFYVGRIDGIIGPSTESAIKAFQRSRGIDETGKLDWSTAQSLNVYVASYYYENFKFDRLGYIANSSSGAKINFYGVRSDSLFCFYVSRR